jgi:Domain of unknown function (DUF4157)
VSGCQECPKRVQRRPAAPARSPAAAPPIVRSALRSAGQPLDGATRAFMEPRFGHSFAGVRVHADGESADSAASIGAKAYAVGQDVVFGAGAYRPTSAEGRRLIAHELAHVVQQSGAAPSISASLDVGPADAPEEREAERAAEAVLSGGAAGVERGGAAAVIARAPTEGTAGMHEDAARQWRREHGLPESGVDETGQRVGPSTSQLAHSGAGAPQDAPCPNADDERALLCITADRAEGTVTCRMSPAHLAVLADARSEARARVNRAVKRMTSPTPALRSYIVQQARTSFAGHAPAYEAILATLTTMQGLLAGTNLRVEGAACNDHDCYSGGVMAYVPAAGQQPVYVCMRSFNPSVRRRLAGTLIHESAHVAGVATEDSRSETYCDNAGCGDACLPPEHADAWRHFADCVGAGLPVRTDFNREAVRSVEEGV